MSKDKATFTIPPAMRREPCMIRVVVREDGDPDRIWHDETGDHNAGYFRDWISTTEHWAMRNGKTLTMYPITYTDGRVAQR